MLPTTNDICFAAYVIKMIFFHSQLFFALHSENLKFVNALKFINYELEKLFHSTTHLNQFI